MASGCSKSCSETATAFSTEACCMCAVNPTYWSRDSINHGLMQNRSLGLFEDPTLNERHRHIIMNGQCVKSSTLQLLFSNQRSLLAPMLRFFMRVLRVRVLLRIPRYLCKCPIKTIY